MRTNKMYYTGLVRTEILDLIKQQQAAILNLKTHSTHTDGHQTKAVIDELQLNLQEKLAALTSAVTRTTDTAHNPTDYELIMWQQSLRDAMRDIRKFQTGNDINRLITDLNKSHTIQVKPEHANYYRSSQHSC